MSKRELDVLRVICEFAKDHPGATPTAGYIAEQLGISQQYVANLIQSLTYRRGRLRWTDRYKYEVVGAAFDPPDDVEV